MDPRIADPSLPSRPPGERLEPEPASASAQQGGFVYGGTVQTYSYVAGYGYFPVIFGLNWQSSSIMDVVPMSSRRMSFVVLIMAFFVLLSMVLM